ncbi:uncharacterized protein HMPREF1541_03254 [Cyphellophora europaea CBS 101466]|uniref:Major facilitator superfamily (MFS) profile domain-containing protein n=1 Tax=Cyphellophora europaea (strain CBS 101466) TaxID=1220924 RepID=W2S043_CYPE1|nr:uncharacterized protein HMPREF1541_03254 [Cyphellophora europaea CBS 101466]ETN41319.1 hypothetical protein HMPREF1541_03254 [Cyphellophora europaea CBS 101466]
MGSPEDDKTTTAHDHIIEESSVGVSAYDPEKVRRPTNDTTTLHSVDSVPSTVADNNQRDAEAALQRIRTPKQKLVRVPRKQRRGWFATFALIPEVTNPYDYKDSTKWFITFIVSISGAAAPVGSAIIFPTLEQVTRELHTTPVITNLTVALYMLSMAIFPLWWSAFSEASGRRSVYIASFALFVVFSILSAISQSIGMLIAMRMLAGGAAASVQAVGVGTIADVWLSEERGRAMGFFYLGPLCGPLFAPILGGIVGERWSWRATQWALVIYGALTWTLVFFGLPETLKSTSNLIGAASEEVEGTDNPLGPTMSRTSTRESVQQRSKQYIRLLRMLFIDPLKIFVYLRYPAVFLTIYYASVTFGTLYVLNISITYTFERAPYNFTTLIIGLLYLPNSLGYILASVLGGRWMDYIMKREAVKANRVREGKLVYQPEDRMRENAWLGALLYPVALIWFGWTAEKGVYWLAPMIANFFYGIGSMLIFAMATTMLTEFMPQRSSSGVALNNFVRNIFSCAGGIVGAPLISAIGNGWLFTILGLWALSSASVIWAMRRFGPRWRIKMEEDFG